MLQRLARQVWLVSSRPQLRSKPIGWFSVTNTTNKLVRDSENSRTQNFTYQTTRLFATKSRSAKTKSDKSLTSFKRKNVATWTSEDFMQWVRTNFKYSKEILSILADHQLNGDDILSLEAEDSLVKILKVPRVTATEIVKALQKHITQNLIDEWKTRCKDPDAIRRNLIGQFADKLPIVQREEETAKVWAFIQRHYEGWTNDWGSSDSRWHETYFAYGPPGSGKTKFGLELVKLLQQHGKQLLVNNTATEKDKSIIKLLDNAITIHISFARGCGWNDSEEKKAEPALVARAIMSLFNIQPDEYFNNYFKRFKEWTLQDLLEFLSKEFRQTKEPLMVYFHVDEVNHLYNIGEELFKEAIKLLSKTCADVTKRDQLFCNVMFTGTAYREMKEVYAEDILLSNLSYNSIKQVISRMHQSGQIHGLDDNWESNESFFLTVLASGGHPRALECILQQMEVESTNAKMQISSFKEENFNNVVQRAKIELGKRYGAPYSVQNIKLHEKALVLGILNKPVHMVPTSLLDREKTVSSLIKFGNVIFNENKWPRGWRIQIPSMWFARYMNKMCMAGHYRFATKEVVDQLSSIQQSTWSNSKEVTATILMLRTNALRLLQQPVFSMDDLFPSPTLGREKVRTEKFRRPTEFNDKRVSSLKELRTNSTGTIDQLSPGTVWINTEQGSWPDLWVVYESYPNNTYTVIFVQTHFSKGQKGELKTMEIVETYKKLEQSWMALNESADIRDKYEFQVVFITNLPVVYNHKAEDELKRLQEANINKEKFELEAQAKEQATQNLEVLAKCITYDSKSIESLYNSFSNQVLYAASVGK